MGLRFYCDIIIIQHNTLKVLCCIIMYYHEYAIKITEEIA
jgi:hypothetical protein